MDDVEQRAWRNTLVIVAAALAMSCSLLAIARVADVAALTAAADALSTSSLGEQSTDEFRLSSAALVPALRYSNSHNRGHFLKNRVRILGETVLSKAEREPRERG